MNTLERITWYETQVRPFLAKHVPERLPSLDSDCDRLKRLIKQPDGVTICFLGNSGVGKSTLLNALAAGNRQVLPSGGIGPLTARATEVSFSKEPWFQVVYQPRKQFSQLVATLALRHFHLTKPSNRTTAPSDLPEDIKANLDSDDLKEAMQTADAPNNAKTLTQPHQKIQI
jgi:ABC-type arginine transport system ATPase subunit